jgi:hypothetical protein
MHTQTGVVAVVAWGWLFLAGSVQGAFIYDSRFNDGAKSQVVEAGRACTLQLWGQISGDTVLIGQPPLPCRRNQ